MNKKSLKTTNDSAKGPASGYLFQFETALLTLTDLTDKQQYVSIEEVDDVSTHSKDGTVLLTMQLKHSIACSGSTFSDTSIALWRTFEIWISKLENGLLNKSTTFICATNKHIDKTSLLRRLTNLTFEKALVEIQDLLKSEKSKLRKATAKDPERGTSIKEIIRLIQLVLRKNELFKIVHKNLKVTDNERIKETFLGKLHMGTEHLKQLQKDRIYDEFYGWIINTSKARWLNGKEARLTKQSFDDKWYHIVTNPAIVSAIFRTKHSLGSIAEHEILSKKKELFVRQIEDIKRNQEAKVRIIRDAIINFICTEIEITYVVQKGDYTEVDFEEFMGQCQITWQSTFDNKVIKEIDEYNEAEKNDLAIQIYNTIMEDARIEFKEGFSFTTANNYMKKGCFLRLSNEPLIGWHPEWKSKYTVNEEQ